MDIGVNILKLVALTLLFFLFAFAGCGAVLDSDIRSDNPDRASYTPGSPTLPTATPRPPDYPTSTPTATDDDRGSATPCDPDGCPRPTATDLPSDYPTPTLNSDQVFLTLWAGTPSQTPNLDDRATHAALEQTMEAEQ